MSTFPYPSEENAFLFNHIENVAASFARFVKRPLLDVALGSDLSRKLFFADFVLLSHNTDAPPVFNYANRAGLSLFEMEWDAFVCLPSQYSAEPDGRAERERLLHAVSTFGYIDDYRGVRISSSGRRFVIERATVWNVLDRRGEKIGQAACFRDWHYIDD